MICGKYILDMTIKAQSKKKKLIFFKSMLFKIQIKE
jgi:hypothetical protein